MSIICIWVFAVTRSHVIHQNISICRKLCSSWHSFLRLSHISFVWEIWKFNLIVFQLLKIEAIQIFLFIDVLVIIFIRNFSTSKLKSISRWLSHLSKWLSLDDFLILFKWLSLDNSLTLSRAFERLY